MSFFSGAKKMIKKNVNFKTLVKVGTMASGLVPVIGGSLQTTMGSLVDAHNAKKAGRQAEAQAKLQEAADTAGNAIGSNAATFISKTAKKAYDTASEEVKAGAGQVGASVLDSTINEWFKNHWKLIAGIAGGLVGAFFIIPKLMHSSGRSSFKPRRR
jgi:uncharacterized protein YjbJ (UPF0337 family)